MTFSIELLPAPLGPMMARTSCSRTSNESLTSAFTPPNEREMLRRSRTTSPRWRSTLLMSSLALGGFPRRRSDEGFRIADNDLGANLANAAVFELDHGLNVLRNVCR